MQETNGVPNPIDYIYIYIFRNVYLHRRSVWSVLAAAERLRKRSQVEV